MWRMRMKKTTRSESYARKMINMMMAINKDNFEGKREVTCYSCHRGSARPVGTPIITDGRVAARR